ncbi:MAG: Ig-like domain-containing protein [Acidobacteriia bacterium]|nr:Ig-like domain-containing protein [Terriglobia bacterium]
MVLMIALAGCGGGGSSSTVNTPSSIAVSPAVLSLNLGDVVSASGTLVNSSGTAIANPPTITFSSSNTSVVTVSSSGAVCAGKWDTNFIVCDTTGFQPGTANITLTSGSITATIPVYTHLHVDRVTASPAVVDCVSSGQTQQMSAKALSNGVDITSSVGPFSWSTLSVDVGTIDANGLVTAKTPGETGIVATVGNVKSAAATWITCPVQSINVHLASGPDTTFSLGAAGNTVSLAADLLDKHGNSISAPLNWSSSQASVANVNSAALVTAAGPGTVGITASCAGSCNVNLASVYSNVVKGTVAGTSATTIYAAGTSSTSLVPIDSITNAAGTAIALPSTPNSFLFDAIGTTGYLGSSGGLMELDASTNTVTQNVGLAGSVLAVSPDGNRVIVAGSNIVYVVGVGTGITSEASAIVGATAADFTPDSRGAYVVAGNALYFWSSGSFRILGLGGVANDVKLLANGAFAYLAGGAAGPAVTARAVCDNSLADTVTTAGTPSLVRSQVDASQVLAVDSSGMDVVTPATTRVGCPPTLSDTLTRVDFGVGAFTARQLFLLPDGSKAFVTSGLGQLLGLNTSTLTPFTIPLVGGASPFTGGTTLDGKTIYLGASDNKVHRIDAAAGADVQQIGVSFTPDLVAVRRK